MKKVIILRYSEIFLKGKNRGFFERALETNVHRALKGFEYQLDKQSGRYFIREFDEMEVDVLLKKLQKVFGIHTLSLAYETQADMDSLFEAAKLVTRMNGTFKVESHRGDKKYPLTSIESRKELGGRLLE